MVPSFRIHSSRSTTASLGRFPFVLVIAVVALVAPSASAQESLAPPRVESWRQDLQVMAGLVTKLHANAAHTISRQAFEAEAARLYAAIPTLEEYEIIVRMAQLMASIGDAHTRLNTRAGAPGVPADVSGGFVRLPLRLQWFAEGLFVRFASRELEALVGTRVVEIGAVPVEEAIDRILPVVHYDNDMTRRLLLPGYATTPAVLRATGVVRRAGPIRFVLETADGQRVERHVDVSADADAGGVDVGTPPGVEIPWWRQSRGRPYWLDSIPVARAIYVQLNASRQYDDEPMAAFVERLRGLLEKQDIQRVVLDLRQNDGGDSELTRPLLALLAAWDGASPDHGLFVLIGRATFSAAVVLAAELERYTGAVLVGEPTGGRPNQYGEIETFALPHSGLTVSYASWYFQTSDPWDARPWVTPDLFVDLTFEDFSAGRDRVLETALFYDFRTPPLHATLIRVARDQGVVAALEAYRRFRAAPERRYTSTERALTELVIDLWRRDQVAASLPVALLVVDEYPESFEAHENVAEVYADQGNAREAVRYAIESLRLYPGNGDALSVLRDVCGDDVLTAFLASDPAGEMGQAMLRAACERATGR